MKSARMDLTGQHRKPGQHGRGFAARALLQGQVHYPIDGQARVPHGPC